MTEAEKHLCEELEEESRLFIVDAGRSADELRQRWPDAARHAIVPGEVRWRGGHPSVSLLETELYVPRRFAAAAEAVRAAQEACHRLRKDENCASAEAALPGPLLRVGARGLAWIAAWNVAQK